MGTSQTIVGRLALPNFLIELINGGRWSPPRETELIGSTFGDQPDYPSFYDIASMRRQNADFHMTSQSDLEELVPGSSAGLGIDPALAVLIGSLGADMPIALDYRLDADSPRIIYLGQSGWHSVASNIEELSQMLRL